MCVLIKNYYSYMGKIKKYGPVFCLWLAGLILNAHQIIPHDHHSAYTYADQDNKCPGSDTKHDHRSGVPIHCHALNDLVLEKVRIYSASRNIQLNITDIDIFKEVDISLTQIQGKRFFSLPETVFDSASLRLSYLRGPPVLA